MKKIFSAAVLSLAVTAPVTLPIAAHAEESPVQQYCVDFTDNGQFYPHLAEDYATYEAMRGHRVAAFVNTASGCSVYGSGDGEVWNQPNPYDSPAQCEPAVVTKVVEVSSVQTVNNPKLVRKIERQRATIKRLRAKLAALKANR